MKQFLTEEYLRACKKHFFVEVYRNGVFENKGVAQSVIQNGVCQIMVFNLVVEGHHSSKAFPCQKIVNETEFHLFGASDLEYFQLTLDNSPRPKSEYSHMPKDTSEQQIS